MLSIAECWDILERHAKVNCPDFGTTLPDGASPAAIREAEAALGVEFPEDVRQFFHCHDGSDPFFISPYKVGGGGQTLTSLKETIRSWRRLVNSNRKLAGRSFVDERQFALLPRRDDGLAVLFLWG